MTRPIKANEVHVHVGRLVIDRAALGDAGSRGLHDTVAERIRQRIENADMAHAHDSPSPGPPRRDLSDAIATAVAAQVTPRVSVARRR